MSQKENPNQKNVDLQTTYAYQTLDSFIEAFNRAASSKPEETPRLINQLKIECLQKMPDLFEALTVLVPREHQPIIYEFFKALTKVVKTWGQTKKP